MPRSLDTALTGPDDTSVVCKKNSLDLVKEAVKKARDNGYKILPTDDKKKPQQEQGRRSQAPERRPVRRLRVPQHPSGGHGFGQQRPDRGDAGALHRADLARGSPTIPPATSSISRRLGHLRVPGQLPERPEPGLRPGRGSGPPTRPTRRSRTVTASPTRATAFAATSRSRARGVRPTTSSSTPRRSRGPELKELGVPIRTSASASTAPTASCSRNMTFAHALEHGVYVMETDGFLLDRPSTSTTASTAR